MSKNLKKFLHDNSLEIFNKMQQFLQIKSHLAICKLLSSSNLAKFS
ncbi:SLEI domain protein, PF07620 family [Leptospira interrogans serovar Valbuzzi str. Valbuzzi]|nr:SLEI domain protein, PF07620 family [Leptospira interrogans serovar Valbuzzi str. Valbuzzi]